MPTCNLCGKTFPCKVVINGKIRNTGARLHCLDCIPFGSKRVLETTREKLSALSYGRKMSIEAREKLSLSMRRAHSEGRAHNIGASRWNNEPSYPEKFFMSVLDKHVEDVNYVRELPVGKYSIDFAWEHKMIAIEIDGSQHEKLEYKERDAKKDALLHSLGWVVLRIKWSDLYNNIEDYITLIRDLIDNAVVREVNFLKSKALKVCKNCGVTIKGKSRRGSDLCPSCSNVLRRKIDRPATDILCKQVNSIGYSATGRLYGVSDNAIRKWIKEGSQ